MTDETSGGGGVMGVPGSAPIRTELVRQIRERRMTFQEFVDFAERFARENGEDGTLSFRQLQRLAAGRRPDGTPLGSVRPATARLLEKIFGMSIADLLGRPKLQTNDDTSDELRRMLSASSRIDSSVIILLRTQLDSTRRLDRQLGAIVAHEEVAAKVSQVERLRQFCLSPGTRSALGALQSELCTLAGWQALDLGKRAEAWNYYERGKAAASECDDPSYLVHTVAEQAFVLLDVDNNEGAVKLLEPLVAQATAVSSLLASWLYAAVGEAYAATGDISASMGAFDKASARLAAGENSTDGPYVALDPTHLARWRGHALARLGAPEAIDLLNSALDCLDPSFTRAATSLRVDLGTAHLMMGERDEARRHIDAAASSAATIGSVRQQRRITALLAS
ncbi:hypothetical protein ACTG9Q_11555 [Actinokineospora sp. 24-640]